MVLNNYRAMERIRHLKNENLSPEAVLELHGILTTGILPDPTMCGRLRGRNEAVRVEDHYGEILHIPPLRSN